jgi:hypothetical protein
MNECIVELARFWNLLLDFKRNAGQYDEWQNESGTASFNVIFINAEKKYVIAITFKVYLWCDNCLKDVILLTQGNKFCRTEQNGKTKVNVGVLKMNLCAWAMQFTIEFPTDTLIPMDTLNIPTYQILRK